MHSSGISEKDCYVTSKYRPECDSIMSGGTTNLGHLCPEVMRKWVGHVEQRQGDWEGGSHHVSFMRVSVGNKKTAQTNKTENMKLPLTTKSPDQV